MDFPLAPIPSIAVGELSVGTASTVNSRRKRAAGGAPPSPRSTKRSTYSETERSPLDRAGSDTARSSEPRSRPMCFRISNVPLTWGKEDLVEHLKRVGFVDKGHNRVSLYPACSGDGQVALLNLVEYFEWFRQLSITGSDTLPGCGSETNLQIDRHFYGLTPLNNPKKNIAADVVAVTGLAGHAYGSWKNRTKNRMWLHDFLPCEFNNIRIMTYGYDTTLQSADDTDPANVNPAKRILDLRRAFVTSLTNARSSPERPIVFLGHSLGGILILQALLQCKLHSMHQDLIEATRTICFFGTPQKGLRTAELEEAVNEEPNKVANLLFQLRVGSEFLETQADDLVEVLSQCNVVTFYETVETATVTKSSTTGKWTRDGPPAIMVTKDSAQLFLPNEQRIPVSSNHSDIVKFPDPSNETYRSVVTQIKMCIDMVVRQREISRKITHIS
ncbi:hypothetical protein BZA05DRAFT_118723 [Tricharina praecox]|uniref:uncharacterized protein n=1 Tax=Tricharina praecox TaxID=43433 RepID=UPI0022211875|nr:uncharacterized protein BZA05DRAFT_118723 [Tricharina praecox]KAI5848046.1 hypothetical protein BZA05DRAFT_118723 [Tricharina praecox]